jgi:hypothetical protein
VELGKILPPIVFLFQIWHYLGVVWTYLDLFLPISRVL